MEMNKFIEKAEKKAGKQIELARILGISDAYIRMVKTGRRGFSDDICIKLADYIEEDRLEVIAASNLVTEKDEEKRKVFESCLKKSSKAATVTITAFVISILTLAPQAPIHADQNNKTVNNINYKQLERRRKYRRQSDFMSDYLYRLLTFFRRGGLKAS